MFSGQFKTYTHPADLQHPCLLQTPIGRALREMDPVAHLLPADIRAAIRNSAGTKGGLFGSEVAFEMLMKPQIRLLEGPVARCVDRVYDEMVQICHVCTSEVPHIIVDVPFMALTFMFAGTSAISPDKDADTLQFIRECVVGVGY